MSVEALQQPPRRPARAVVTPNRLPAKGTGFFRPSPAAAAVTVAPGGRKQSAVERLEADKAKYVKSQVALSKQQPIRPPAMRKPLLSPNTELRPTRRAPPSRPGAQQVGAPLDLEHLSNLINGVSDAPLSSTTADSEESQPPDRNSPLPTGGEPGEGTPHSPCPDWSSPAKVRLKAAVQVKGESPGSAGSPAAVAVRRVDVKPQARSGQMSPCRVPQQIRLPLQPMPLHPYFQLHTAATNLRLFHPRTIPGPSPLKPVPAPPLHEHAPLSPAPVVAPPAAVLPPDPPASPAVTRLSTSSTRKRPCLTRSKSDMSDRVSRVGTDLERFFNLCGLEPAELQQALVGPGSDIVSIARLRSASAPGSECAGTGREDEEEEEEVAERTPYGVSVIERNARVIKWLYGLRQAKDSARSTNM